MSSVVELRNQRKFDVPNKGPDAVVPVDEEGSNSNERLS